MASRGGVTRGYAAPAILLVVAVLFLGWLLRMPGLLASKTLVSLAAAGMVWRLWWLTGRTNRAVARFVEALRHRDLGQSFRQLGQGSAFDELGAAFDDALRHLRSERHASVSENRFASALVDESPTPLLAIDPNGTVQLANKAARSLFGDTDGRAVAEFARYGSEFATMLGEARPGQRAVCRIVSNGLRQRAVVVPAIVDRQGQPWRIVAIHIIQSELDAAEIATQADLVRVLTHEIMNSLTPVTSLAASAERMIRRADEGDPQAAAKARVAIETLARRASELAHFVESYREFSRSPAVTVRSFEVRPWLDELLRSFAATPQAEGVELTVDVAPGLRIDGDAGLLGQVVLNLLKNGAEAARDHAPQPHVSVEGRSADGGRARLIVGDNGPGVPDHLTEDVFLPFFTTKARGTGVGLSFARQIVLLHGGAIGLGRTASGGAQFDLLL